MKRLLSLLLFAGAVGCGSNQSTAPSAEGTQASQTASPAGVKPSPDETISSIREFFTHPGVGFKNVQVENLSEPIAAPREAARGWGETWVFSVTMNCNNIVGDRQQNKDWLVVVGRENGRATVKDYYHNLERIEQSPLGKEWFAQKGFPTPAVVHSD